MNTDMVQFADSKEGRACVAAARRVHDYRERHKGGDALPFTDAMERAALRDGMVSQSRAAVSVGALQQSASVRALDTYNATKARDAARDARFPRA